MTIPTILFLKIQPTGFGEVHTAKGEVFGAGTVEDGSAGGDGLLGVGIEAGAELGMIHLKGYGMEDVAYNQNSA